MRECGWRKVGERARKWEKKHKGEVMWGKGKEGGGRSGKVREAVQS